MLFPLIGWYAIFAGNQSVGNGAYSTVSDGEHVSVSVVFLAGSPLPLTSSAVGSLPLVLPLLQLTLFVDM